MDYGRVQSYTNRNVNLLSSTPPDGIHHHSEKIDNSARWEKTSSTSGRIPMLSTEPYARHR